MKLEKEDFESMIAGYIECALFTADEELIPPKSGQFEVSPWLDTVSNEMKLKAARVCMKFARENIADLSTYPATEAGHDLWYTRGGHGVGFWEADHCTKEEGERLTEAAELLGEDVVVLGDDRKFYTE